MVRIGGVLSISNREKGGVDWRRSTEMEIERDMNGGMMAHPLGVRGVDPEPYPSLLYCSIR